MAKKRNPMYDITTSDGHNMKEAISAIQKEIRRGNTKQALYWAHQLHDPCTNGISYGGYCFRRLRIIASEDIGIANNSAAIQVGKLSDTYDSLKKDLNAASTRKILISRATIILAESMKSRVCDNAIHVWQTRCNYPEHIDLVPQPKDHTEAFSGKHFYRNLIEAFKESNEQRALTILFHCNDAKKFPQFWKACLEYSALYSIPNVMPNGILNHEYQTDINVDAYCLIDRLHKNFKELEKKAMNEKDFWMHFIFMVHAVLHLSRMPAINQYYDFYKDALQHKEKEIPDYALDMHTIRGKMKGRSWAHFHEVGALVNNQAEFAPNIYRDEANELMKPQFKKTLFD